MAIIKSFASYQNLSNFGTFINDQVRTSEYFRITEFKDTFTGGKNGFLIEGSEHLKETTEIKIEILDVTGTPIYYEPGDGIPEYYEGISKIISVHVYEDTPIGLGKITVLGELKTYIDDDGVVRDVPAEWRGIYNIKWERTFNVNKNLANETIVRFYKRPKITIDEINKPVFNITTPSITQTGLVEGIPQQPVYGTDIRTWTAGTLYKLKITDGSNWTSSVDENIVNVVINTGRFDNTGNIIYDYYNPTIREVLNNKEVFVDVPYLISSSVSNFSANPYTTTFDHIEGQTIINSALTGSFAKIQLSDLKTFVGDVARVKVYRKSRNEVGDYQFIQDTKLESSEILKDITTTANTELSYGQFTESNIKNYWVSGSTTHPITINVDKLNASIQVDYTGTNYDNKALFITSQSLSLTEGVEYTLSFKTLLSGSVDPNKILKAYFSGSDYPQQTIVNVANSAIYTTKQNVTQNVKATKTGDAKLVFEFAGDDWYLANVSLQNAQETSFSPDEFTLIQDIPRKLASETYDFKFEFYDINNNYIPVDVKTSKTFNGGNSFTTTSKILTFESDRTAFRFSTGSFGNPAFQQVGFKVTRQNLTGSVTYASAAFDTNGNYIVPASYGGTYPGLLTNAGDGGASLTIANFSGSVTSVLVGSITYTASCDGLNEFETIYRFEDGDNAPGVFVTANTNQFIYKATDLSLNPSGQIITIEAKRKNLASSIIPLTVNSGSGKPPLTLVSTNATNGVDTYTIAGSSYPFSTGETSYSISGSDQFGNVFSDTIKITPVKILDGFSVATSNENTSFPANSVGSVIGGFIASSGSITVKVGNEVISYASPIANNKFSASISSTSGLTPNTFNGTNYSINALSADSGSLTLLVKYQDGGGTIISSSKEITYSKVKKAAPVLSFVVGNNNQTATAKSTGEQIDAFVTASLSVIETYEGVSSTKILASAPDTTTTNSYTIGNKTTTTIALPNMANGTDSVDISVTGSVVDSENTTRNVFGNISLAKAKKAVPTITFAITPASQTVAANSAGTLTGTIVDPILTAFEGSTALTYNSGTLTTSQYKITNVTGVTVTSTTPSTSTIDVTAISATDNTGIVTISYVDSEGTPNTATIKFTISKSIAGTNGTNGDNGAQGGDGPGVVFRGPWSSTTTYNSISQDPTRRDVVLYSGTYYATLSNATANLNKIPNTQTTFWQSLGPDSFFVAAEMFISKESYVQNTINVGTNGSGNANITIAGGTTSPYISIGQATKGYNNVGAFLGSDGTNGKLSLKSSTNSLLWDGESLTINGAGTFTGALSGGTISIGSGNSIFQAAGPGIWLGAAAFGDAPFRVTPSGLLTATSGTIGGWTLSASSLIGGNATFANTGNLTLGTSNDVIRLSADDATYRIWVGHATAASAPFRVTKAGVLTASGVSISGAITATSGTFTGTVTATDGTFNGTVNASLGNIGGWIIGATTLTSTNDAVTLDSAGKKITIKNTAGAPSVIMSQASSFSSFGGSYSNSGNHGSTNATGGSTPNTQTRLIASNAITAAGAPSGTSILFTVREKTSNGTTALSVSNGVNALILTYIWFLRNTTTGQDIQIHRDSAGEYVSGTTTTFIGGFDASSSITIAGSGHNWDLYQSTQWSYSGFGSTTASTILYPAGEWTAEQVTSFTEIIDGGIQTGNSPLRYVKLQRSAATTMIEVGGAITATDNITAYASDRRLKENIVPIDNALERVEQLNGVHYSWKDNVKNLGFQPSNLNDTGLFAQEVQAVLPNAVKLAPFDNNDGVSISGENYLTIQYEKLVPLLVEAIKELSAEIKELKKGR